MMIKKKLDDDKEKADGIISAMIKDVDKGYTPLVRYEEGCVYKTRNNDKLRFIKYGYDNFMSLGDNSYKSKYIVDSTSHIFYVLGKNSSLDHLKAFHDKFNRIWCGSDFVYDDEKSFVPSSNEYRVFYSTVAAKRYDKRNTRDVFLFFGCNESDYEKFMEDRPGLERYYQRMPGMEKQLYGEANFSWEKLKVGLPKDATLYPRQPYNVHCMNHESSLVRSVLSLCPDALLASEVECRASLKLVVPLSISASVVVGAYFLASHSKFININSRDKKQKLVKRIMPKKNINKSRLRAF